MTDTLEAPVRGDHPPPPVGRVSFEEFLAWCPENTWAEWVDGEIILMSPSDNEHQFVLGFLHRLIGAFVEERGLGWVFLPPFLMRLATRPSGREPDLMFLASEHGDRDRRTYIDGPADLVVEIVSPDSGARDRGEKFVEYEQAGVPEYWVIDLVRQQASFYRLGEDGRYRPGPVDDGWYASAVLAGFRLRVDWLWQRPLPTVAEATRQQEA
jgi:Uma2 family endonuclease